MNPRTILWQVIVLIALVCTAALVVDPLTGFVMAGIGLELALVLNVGYAHALGAQGRPSRRLKGDRMVGRLVILGFGVPLVLSAVAALAGHTPNPKLWEFNEIEIAALFIAPAVLFTLIVLSSLVDWYYVRPRIDGVVREPPCRSPKDGIWKRVTRRWLLHRTIATVAYFLFALSEAFAVMLMLAREHPVAAGVVGGVGGLAGLFLIFVDTYRAQLPTVAKWILGPAFRLGEDLRFGAYMFEGRGYVLHVSVPVTKLAALDEHGAPIREEDGSVRLFERRNTDLSAANLDAQHRVLCPATCQRLNPECVFGEHRSDTRARSVIF